MKNPGGNRGELEQMDIPKLARVGLSAQAQASEESEEHLRA